MNVSRDHLLVIVCEAPHKAGGICVRHRLDGDSSILETLIGYLQKQALLGIKRLRFCGRAGKERSIPLC